jgi:molybdate transport system ATP-binding protein
LAQPGAALAWQVRLRKRLQHGRQHFSLDLAFSSAAPRVVLFGPSGAGKTQTLKMVAGLVRPDEGRVVLAGRTLFDSAQGLHLSPQQRRLGYLFQDYALFPHLTVRQNIGFSLQAGWWNPGRRRHHPEVQRWLKNFELQAVADLYPHQVSGGQRQRTALARALLNQPQALLLDEPFAALDSGLRRRLRADLAALQRELALPLLLITHDEDDVLALADTVVPLEAGRAGPVEAAAPG